MVLRHVGLRSLTTLILKAESFLGPGSVPPVCSLAKQASGGTVYEPVRVLPSRRSAGISELAPNRRSGKLPINCAGRTCPGTEGHHVRPRLSEYITLDYSCRYRGITSLDHEPADFPMDWTVSTRRARLA